MEVYMRNLAFTVNKTNLKTEIAKALHHQDFLSVTVVPMNFEVHIFPRRGRARTQCGVLTLPTEAIGEQFLRIYGGQRPRKHITIGTRITFSQSNKPPRADILEEIRRVPFVDPRVEERRRDTESQLRARPVSVQCLQFGWECRDNVFSVEWEHQCPGYGRLMYSQDQREFRIKLFAENNIHIIVIQAAQVQWASAEDDESRNPVIFFSLAQPPSYETEVPPLDVLSMLERLTLENGEETRPPPASRERWSAIDTSHAEVAPYVSVAVRLVCQGASDLETFRWISSLANIGLQPFTYPVARRGLFAPAVRQEYESWLKSLPWAIAFQVESMTRDIYLDLKEMLMLRGRIENMINAQGVPHVVNFLRHFAIQLKTLFHYEDDSQGNTGSVEELFVRCEQDYVPPSRKPSLAGLAETFDCLHVTVTPTTMKLAGPFPERSNRVMRLYPQNHDSFLRVNFTDDNKLHLRFDREVDGQAFIKRRVGDMLHKGIWIAGRHFDFLAYSQSALKEHAVWFVKPFVDSKGQRVTAATIIDGLGTFDGLAHDPQLINCPARYGARISQAFTATDSSVSAEAEEVFILEDIEDTSGKWCFTDGVGTISPELIRAIWKELRARRRRTRNTPPYPRAVQIRFMGSKGMLSVDYNLSGRAICLRPSMIKFEAPNSRNIEIARAFDKPGPFYLNRPLIMILEDLGVQYKTFYDLQVTAVKEAERSRESLGQAARLLERFGLGTSFRLTSVMLSLEKLGVGPLRDDVFWKQMMDFAINHVLRGLKHHARIPVENAWNVVGVADIHKYLNEGEVFVHIAPTNGQPSRYLEGPTLVTRSPTIHPGDVQVVHAIGKPPPGSPFEKESLRNCVVFSVKG